MKRAKKQGRRSSGMPGAGGAQDMGDVASGGTNHPPASSRARSEQPGGTLSAANKKAAAHVQKNPSTAKALARWENEGGRAQAPPAETTPVSTAAEKKSKPKPENQLLSTPVSPDRSSQRRAESRAKESRIKRAGIESRLLGHVSASGRRNQARRDSRKR